MPFLWILFFLSLWTASHGADEARDVEERRAVTLSKADPFVVVTDIGFDYDDYGALRLILDAMKSNGISADNLWVIVTYYNPAEKACIVRTLLDDMGFGAAQVFVGPGPTTATSKTDFFEMYPYCPPAFYDGIYTRQLEAATSVFGASRMSAGVFARIRRDLEHAWSALEDHSATVLGIAAHTVFAEGGPCSPDKIKKCISMGGYKIYPGHSGRATLAYNWAMDAPGADAVLRSGKPVTIVPPTLCDLFEIPFDVVERLRKAPEEIKLAFSLSQKVMWEALFNWQDYLKKRTGRDCPLILSDVVTAVVALEGLGLSSKTLLWRPRGVSFRVHDLKVPESYLTAEGKLFGCCTQPLAEANHVMMVPLDHVDGIVRKDYEKVCRMFALELLLKSLGFVKESADWRALYVHLTR